MPRVRPLALVGIPLAGFLLTAFFIYQGFPYDRLRDSLTAEVGRATGARIVIQQIAPRLQLAGPGIEASGIRVARPGGETLQFDRALLRPAWSLSWLRGRPAIHAKLEGPVGSGEGVLGVDGAGPWSGELRDVDVSELPVGRVWPGARISGRLDASFDLSAGERGLEGTARFDARQGTLTLPDGDFTLPYETITAELILGGEQRVEITSLTIQSPLVSASIQGTLGHASQIASSPLNLSVELDAQPAVRPLLTSAGLPLDADGKTRLQITGTPSNPSVR